MKEKEYTKYLNQDSWYHGTTLSAWKDLCKDKVQHDYNKGTELDFGYGFYLTPKYNQAKNYINRMLPYLDNDKQAVVIEFSLNLSKLQREYKHKCFLNYNEEFAEFVIENRSYPDDKRHEYDFIIGVMSDSNPEGLLADYRLNIINRAQLIQGMMKWTSTEQLSLHNQNICDILIVRKAILIENGEELNVDEYNQK